MGFQIIAISPDKPEKLRATADEGQIGYRLVSDSKMECARAFGLAWKVSDKTFSRYQGYGIDLEQASGENHHLLPVPAVFLVDASGSILFQYVNPDHRVRLDSDLVLAAATVFQKKGSAE